MLFKNRHITQQSEDLTQDFAQDNAEKNEDSSRKPVRKIIDGKMYDTSKAAHICDLCLWHEEIPDYNLPLYRLDLDMFSVNLACSFHALYRGNSKWFIELYGDITPVEDIWVKDILGRHNVDKYIELFGEPELV